MKKKKQISGFGGIAGIAGIGAMGSMALGAIGGPVAVKGQQGLQNAAAFLPATGTLMGAGMLMKAIPKSKKKYY